MGRTGFFGVGAALVLIFGSAPALADARLMITEPASGGQPTPILNASDPVAVSRALGANAIAGSSSWSGAGDAAADLRTGTVRANVFGGVSSGQGSYGSVTATLSDTITVSGPGSTVLVTAIVTVDGGLSAFGNTAVSADAEQSGSASIVIGKQGTGDANISMTVTRSIHTAPATPISDVTYFNRTLPAPGISNAAANSGAATFTLTATATIPVGTATIIASDLDVTAGCGGTCDGWTGVSAFGSTSRLQIILPAGYTYTSGSGVLLSMPGADGLTIPDADAGIDGFVDIGGDGGAPIPGGTGTNDDGGAVSAGGSGGDGGASSGDGGAANAATGGSGDSGGCNVGDSSSTTIGLFFLGFAAIAFGARRRRSQRA